MSNQYQYLMISISIFENSRETLEKAMFSLYRDARFIVIEDTVRIADSRLEAR